MLSIPFPLPPHSAPKHLLDVCCAFSLCLVAASCDARCCVNATNIGHVVSVVPQAAKEVSEFLGTVHHSYVYTVQEGLDAIREVSRDILCCDCRSLLSLSSGVGL